VTVTEPDALKEALTLLGEPGATVGVTVEERPLGELPCPLTATTLTMYDVPLVRPLTVHEVVD
jgi:hypothetical protein